MSRIACLTAACLVALPSTALPCSLVPGVAPAATRGTVGPNPLVVTTSPQVALLNQDGDTIALNPVTPPAELAGALGPGRTQLFFFRPASALADGMYNVNTGDGSFMVSSASPDGVPSLGTQPELRLNINEEQEEGPLSCGGITSCGDTSSLLITLPGVMHNEQAPANYIVTFKAEDGAEFKRFVSDQFGFNQTELRFYHSFLETGHLKEQSLCLTIAGVSFDGEIGEVTDLGCIDPDDGEDTRVTNNSTGCAAVSAQGKDPTFAVLIVLMGLARRRRSR